MSYQDLPPEHYRRIARLRDAVAVCLVLDPTVIDGYHVSRIAVDDCDGHALADLLTVCRVYPAAATRVMVETIECHELIRFVQLADSGLVWRWYSEFYARTLNELIGLERVYFQLARGQELRA